MSKYKQYFELMLNDHKKAFESFKNTHDHYTLEPQKYQKQFNDEGQKILDIVQEYENRLCSKSESSGYGRYSSNLADKFREQVKLYLPKVNSIGLQID
ncbi:MAG: hypothetical protein NUV69_01360 [Candidatus Curtissbacteria bacterium]|nr:hypothetical protein [Candidatus Curtissbacteria bacterium]